MLILKSKYLVLIVQIKNNYTPTEFRFLSFTIQEQAFCLVHSLQTRKAQTQCKTAHSNLS